MYMNTALHLRFYHPLVSASIVLFVEDTVPRNRAHQTWQLESRSLKSAVPR